MNSDFYIGYEKHAPPSLAQFVRRTALALLIGTTAIAAIVVLAQQPFAASRFDFLNYQTYEGTLYEWPYPLLIKDGAPYLLVAAGKHGADAMVKGLDGHAVRLRGELIQRGENRMLEIEAGSLHEIAGAAPQLAEVRIGEMTLAGEIVDTKCHFGVMNPGQGKVHRDCAARCISGGIPPGFLVHDASGVGRVLLLTGADRRKVNSEILDYVAEPIHIQGELARVGSAWILRANPSHFRRD